MAKLPPILFVLMCCLMIVGCKKDEGPTQPTSGTIVGKVLTAVGDTAVSNAAVSTRPPTSSVFTNSTGDFTISNVSPGNYVVDVTKAGYFDGNASVGVSAGTSTTANVQLILIVGQMGMIRGVVTNAGGDTLIVGASVTTSPPTSSVTTNSLGEYAISNIAPGSYVVTANKSGYNPGNVPVTVTARQTVIGNIHMNVMLVPLPLWACTATSYSETVDIDAAVQTEMGSSYRVADWNDIVSYGQTHSMTPWADSLGLGSAMVKWNGSRWWSGNRHYFIERHDHNVPPGWLVHATIENHLIDLGSWYSYSRRVLCIRRN